MTMLQKLNAKIGGVYYGWWNAVASMVCLMLIFGVPTVLLPFVYGPVIDEFGWTRAQVTAIASFKFASAALSALAAGFLVDRFGVRKVVVGCCMVTATGMCGFLAIESLVSFYAAGIVLGLAATTIIVAVKTLMSHWFHRNQGLSLGVVMMGSSVAGIVLPFFAAPLIDAHGWRVTFALMSLGIWLVGLPLFLLVTRETPSQEELARELDDATEVGTKPPSAPDSLTSVLRQPMFWLIVCAVFVISFVDQSINQHSILFIERDLGLGAELAARAFSATFVAGVFAKIGFGWIFDRVSIRGIQASYILMAVGIALAFPISGILTALAFALVRGAAHGGLLVQKAIFAKHCFGPTQLGKLIGILTAVASVGYAAGPFTVGWMYDQHGNYRYAFALLLGLTIVAAALLSWVQPTYRNQLVRRNVENVEGVSTLDHANARTG
jgi:MFS family permease